MSPKKCINMMLGRQSFPFDMVPCRGCPLLFLGGGRGSFCSDYCLFLVCKTFGRVNR